jgi:arsenite methyltransferase
MKPEDLKLIVKEKYNEIATQSKQQNESSCCGTTGCCSSVDYTIFSESYDKPEGYNPDADLGLGYSFRSQKLIVSSSN